ncbi:S8 family serine peptidase [Granulicella sp. dw_53]|uniref:S8 family serine peptidase n=1 Tax=Granulicella sp. dw_53 TaxID=2719792 RepID=UPI001BD40F87|nr:S8 family serine peptidase [Granulicella sp. dw_53]
MPSEFPKSTTFLRSLSGGLKAFALIAFAALVCTPSQGQISESASKQIAEVLAFKKTFSPAEQKMSSNLVLASRSARHIPLGNLARFLDTARLTDSAGRLQVEIHGNLSPALMSSAVMTDVVRAGGGDVPQSAYAQRHLHAHVQASQLLELAANPDVMSIQEAAQARTNVGSVTSQGYVSHTANKAVALGYTGAGVTVGVLSDSASPARVAALVASGDLPGTVQVVPGQAGSGEDEGTAMMEIVHDIAPGANLVFASAFNSEASFAANIQTLRFTYHCDIIVDDVSYFDEGAFQDGPVARAVNAVVADGALYFSAAANSGNLTSGTSGTWEGDFRNGGAVTGPLASAGETGNVHNFGTAGSPQNYDILTAASSAISLKWSDPLGASGNDYDLFALNSAGTTLKGFSAASQTGTQDPYEIMGGSNCGTASASGYCGAAGDRLVVVLFSGSARALRVDTNRGTLSIATTGSTYGHNAGLNTISTAATYWNSAKTGTKAFTGAANPIETFSSDGPRKIFYNPDGSQITPGNLLFSTNGGTTLQKPDITAADGGYTATPGFLPFFGTSAAAPHAAGVAALVKGARPSLTNAQIKAILTSTTVDNMAAGVDRDSGYGIVMALPAVQAALALP